MRRRRKGYLVLAFAAVVFFLVNWLMSLFGGGSTPIDTDRETERPEAESVPPTEIDPPPDTVPNDVPAIVGFVRDSQGNAVAGASVLVVTLRDGDRRNIELETDADGRFVEEVPRHGGVVYIEVLKPGHPPLRKRFEGTTLRPGETLRQELTMPSTFVLAGHVKTHAGPPIVGAKVRFGDWITTTGEQGRFRIPDIDAEVLRVDVRPRLIVTHEDHVTVELVPDLEGRRANSEDIQVVMERR